MGTISAETVTKTWQAMDQFNIDDADDFAKKMAAEQPIILAHLLALDDQPFNQHEKEIILYLGMVIWQMMKQSPNRLLKVTRKKLNRAKNANLASLDFLASDTDADFVSAIQVILEKYEEPEVLRYILEALMDEKEYEQSGDSPIRDEYRGIAFVHLKSLSMLL